jgi:hypothetical protein
MKPLNLECPLSAKTQSSLHRSLIHRAIALYNNRAASCAPACFAALLFACVPGANAANLGRLFFTPEQRAQLDYAYARNAAANGNTAAILTVNGIVQKQGGARTVWINGVAQSADNSGERNPTAQTVAVPGKSRPVRLKVGDKIMLDQSAPARQDAPADQ